MSQKLNFTPCDGKCPAVTGEPNGSARFCPMQEHDRHRGIPKHVDPTSEQFYQHKDYTDCCVNMQCCTDLWEEAGLLHVAASILTGEAVIKTNGTPEAIA